MSRTDHRRSHVLDAKWICKWREQERPTNVRTAEVDAAGAVEVVDAEEVRVVRPASAAQEVDHVDPPHLAPASSSCCPLVRVHDAPLLNLSVSPAGGGDNEKDNPREQGDSTKNQT